MPSGHKPLPESMLTQIYVAKMASLGLSELNAKSDHVLCSIFNTSVLCVMYLAMLKLVRTESGRI